MAASRDVRAGRAYVELGVNDALTAGLRKAQAQFVAFSHALRSTGLQLAGISMAFGLPAAMATKTYATFEQAMARVKALTGATGADFEKLTARAEELGRKTVFTATDAAKAMGFFALAGYKVNQIFAAVGPTLDMAAAGQLDIADAADIAAKIMAGMGIEADNLGSAVDVLTKAFTTANTDLRMLGDAMKYVGPVAKAAGVSIQQTTAAIQLLSNAGIQGEMAGTTLRGSILSLTNPSKEAADELLRLGINVNDAKGNFRSLPDIIDEMNRSLSKLGTGARLEAIGKIFDKRQASGFAELLAQGGDRMRYLEQQLTASAGTASDIANVQLATLQGSVTILTSAFQGLQIVLGRELAYSLRVTATLLTGVTNVAADWIAANGRIVRIAAAAAAGIGAMGVSLLGASVAMKVAAITTGYLASAWSAFYAIARLPVAAAVYAVLAPIRLLAVALSGLGTVASVTFRGIVAGTLSLSRAITATAVWLTKLPALMMGVGKSVSGVFGIALGGVRSALSAVSLFVSTLSAGLLLGFKGMSTLAVAFTTTASTAMRLGGAIGTILSGFAELASMALSVSRAIAVAFARSFAAVFPSIVAFATKSIGAIASFAAKAVSTAVSFASKIASGISDVFMAMAYIARGVFFALFDIATGAIVQTFHPVIAVIGKAITTVAHMVSSGIQMAATAVQASVSVVASMVPVLSQVSSALGSIVSGTIQAAMAFAGPLASAIGSVVSVLAMLAPIAGPIILVGAAVFGAYKAVKSLGSILSTIGRASTTAWNTAANGARAATGAILNSVDTLKSSAGQAWSAIATSAGRAWASIRNTAGPVIAGLGRLFGSLKNTVLSIFDTIRNALTSGDMSAAADVAWAGVLLAFQQGRLELTRIWYDIKDDFRNLWAEIWSGARSAMAIGVTAMKDIWSDLVAHVKTLWISAFAEINKVMAVATAKSQIAASYVKTLWDAAGARQDRKRIQENLQGLLGSGAAGILDSWIRNKAEVIAPKPAGTTGSLETDFQADAAKIDADKSATQSANAQALIATQAQITQDLQNTLAAIAASPSASSPEGQAAIQAAEDAVAQATANLGDVIDRLVLEKLMSQGGAYPDGGSGKGGLPAGIGDFAAQQATTVGTFSAEASYGFGAMGVTERIANATEETARLSKESFEWWKKNGHRVVQTFG